MKLQQLGSFVAAGGARECADTPTRRIPISAPRFTLSRSYGPTVPRLHARTTAFTLIELIVVISIMALLAALIIPVGGAIKKRRIISKTQVELRQIATGIEQYKAKHHVYPPDNPGNPLPLLNQLYYELMGTTLNNNLYTLKDGSGSLNVTALPNAFGTANVAGFVNCTKGAGGDEGTIAESFLKSGLKPNQYVDATNGNGTPVKILVASVGLPVPPITGPNPWRYVSTNPTNNPRSYDLWVDIVIGNKTNRICNWSDKQIVL